MLLARNVESTKIPRESLLNAYDRLLSGAPDAGTHPIRSVPEFRGLLLLVGSCSCPRVKCKRSLGRCFLSHFVYPKSRPISTTGAPQSRGVDLC